MGYYSEVGFAIRGPKELVISKLFTYRLEGGTHALDALDSCSYTEADEEGVVSIGFHEDSVKWYESFEDVAALLALYNVFAQDEEARFSCRFIRIGEDDSDLESDSHGDAPYELLRSVRAIEFGVSTDPENSLAKLLGEPVCSP